jgi:hypothetical protein
MATRLRDELNADQEVGIDASAMVAVAACFERYFMSEGHQIERKLSRLTERLKGAIEAGNFGPLFESDGTTRTQVGEIFAAFQSIYKLSTLNSVDEEGNLKS